MFEEIPLKYTVVREFIIQDLIREVNKLIVEGWEPIGGISSAEEHNNFYIQALIKKESK